MRQLVITKCDKYFIAKYDKCYYKVRQVLQSATIITKCDRTPTLADASSFPNFFMSLFVSFLIFFKMLQIVVLFWGILGICRGKREKKPVKVPSQFVSCFVIHFQTGFLLLFLLFCSLGTEH